MHSNFDFQPGNQYFHKSKFMNLQKMLRLGTFFSKLSAKVYVHFKMILTLLGHMMSYWRLLDKFTCTQLMIEHTCCKV